MVEISGIATALPSHRLGVAETKAFLSSLLPSDTAERYSRMVDTSRIRERYTLEPMAALMRIQTPEAREEAYTQQATGLGEIVARDALRAAGTSAASVATVIPVSCTGYMMPSLDAYLMNRLNINPNARRIPIMQLGCAAGVGAVGIASDLLRHAPARAVLVVSVELCSLCLQVTEPSPADVIGSILFGDGAAAAVLKSEHERGVEILASRSVLWPDTTRELGMRFTSTGLRFLLSPEVPNHLRTLLRLAVESLLDSCGLSLRDLRFYAIHPGGPKILDAVAESLRLSDKEIGPSWDVWERYGNLSSATVFFVLRHLQALAAPSEGDLGLMLAIGPGLTCEMVLLRWSGRLRGNEE